MAKKQTGENIADRDGWIVMPGQPGDSESSQGNGYLDCPNKSTHSNSSNTTCMHTHRHTQMGTKADMDSSSGTNILGEHELKLQPELHLSFAT